MAVISGQLNSRPPLATEAPEHFRILLNTGTNEIGARRRMGGWFGRGRRAEDDLSGVSNEDLHDQLLGAEGTSSSDSTTTTADFSVTGYGTTGTMVVADSSWISVGQNLKVLDFYWLRITNKSGTTLTWINDGSKTGTIPSGSTVRLFMHTPANQREAITMMLEVGNQDLGDQIGGAHFLISGTKSRLYVSTRGSRNHRIIGDGFGRPYDSSDPISSVRFQAAAIGSIVLFVNGQDPVKYWRIPDPPSGDDVQAVQDIQDLLDLSIYTAQCVTTFEGYAFLGCGSRIYWCDFNDPLSWAPAGQSTAGYYEFGSGEYILRIEPIGGQLRVYTDQGIYSGVPVGGDAVWAFPSLYKGGSGGASDLLFYRYSLVRAGKNTHIWLGKDSIWEMSEFDRSPQRVEWMHRAVGFIYSGLAESMLADIPDTYPFTEFGEINRSLSHQVVAGYCQRYQEVWISWPTSDLDRSDIGGYRRLSMVMSRIYGKATLVDHGFCSFANERVDRRDSLRDFLIRYGVCAENAEWMLIDKEGEPLNELAVESAPASLYNATEDPTLPADPDSLCTLASAENLKTSCANLEAPFDFLMADATEDDLTIKVYLYDILSREVYSYFNDDKTKLFPEVSDGTYTFVGFPTLIQGEVTNLQTDQDKMVALVGSQFDPGEDYGAPYGLLHCQVGVSNMPQCLSFKPTNPQEISCQHAGYTKEQLEDQNLRAEKMPVFPVWQAGRWLSCRFFVSDQPEDGVPYNYAPEGCQINFRHVSIRFKPTQADWRI